MLGFLICYLNGQQTLSVLPVGLLAGKLLGKIQTTVSSTKDQAAAENPNASAQAEKLSTSEMEHRMKLLRDDGYIYKQSYIFCQSIDLLDFWNNLIQKSSPP